MIYILESGTWIRGGATGLKNGQILVRVNKRVMISTTPPSMKVNGDVISSMDLESCQELTVVVCKASLSMENLKATVK